MKNDSYVVFLGQTPYTKLYKWSHNNYMHWTSIISENSRALRPIKVSLWVEHLHVFSSQINSSDCLKI